MASMHAQAAPYPYGYGYPHRHPNPGGRTWWVVGGILVAGAAVGLTLYAVASHQASQVPPVPPGTGEVPADEPDQTTLDPGFDPSASDASGLTPGERVSNGVRQDRAGTHAWGVVYGGPGVYIAYDYTVGHHLGPKTELGTAPTENLAKRIIRDHYNAMVVETGYPEEQKHDPYIPPPAERTGDQLQYRPL